MLHAIKPKLLMKILPKSELFLISNMFIWDNPSNVPTFGCINKETRNPYSPIVSCSDEGLTLETSVHNHFHGVKLIYINLKLIHYTFILYADAD